jgi:hypothetical protein
MGKSLSTGPTGFLILGQRTGCLPPSRRAGPAPRNRLLSRGSGPFGGGSRNPASRNSGHRSCATYMGSVLFPKGVNHLCSGGSALERLLLRTNDLPNGQAPTPPSTANAAHSPQANWSISQ